MPPIIIAAGIAAGGAIAGGAISSSAAGHAADTQAAAADKSAQLQYQAEQNALAFQERQFDTTQGNLAPYLGAGRAALTSLQSGLGLGTPSYSTVGPSATPGTVGGSGGFNPVSTANRGVTPPPVATTPPQLNLPGPVQNALTSRLRSSAQPGTAPPAINGSNVVQTVRNTFGTNPPAPLTASGTASPPGAAPAGAPPGGYPLVANSLNEQYGTPFNAPTDVTEQNDPGYAFRLKQGQQALERSAAASGNLFTGGTAKDLLQYGQDYASNEYGNVYNRSLGEYQQAYNIFQQNQGNQFNRLAALAGLGQTATGQLSSAGTNAANTTSNTLLGGAAAQSQALQNAAAARGSGYVGSANAIGGALSGATSAATLPFYLQALQQSNSGISLGDINLPFN